NRIGKVATGYCRVSRLPSTTSTSLRENSMYRFVAPILALTLAVPAWAQKDTPKKDPKPAGIPPTMENVAYGSHPRQVVDFYQANSDAPTPLVLAIHGGGGSNGDKSGYRASAKRYLDAGLSVVAINYRFVTQATENGIDPPVKWPLEDAARALQFVRSKAK